MGIFVMLAGIALFFVSGYWRWCAHTYPGDSPNHHNYRFTPGRCTLAQHVMGCLSVALVAWGVWLSFE